MMTPFAYSIPEVCKNSNSGRTTVYKAINDGDLVAHKRGSRTLIFPNDLERWLNSLPRIEAKRCNQGEAVSSASSEHKSPHARKRRGVV
jgi:excisionase family DNA binding protein